MLAASLSLEHCGSGIGELPKGAWAVRGQGDTGQAEWECVRRPGQNGAGGGSIAVC